MKVKEFMTKNVGFCHPENNLTEAAEIMQRRDCGIVPVIDEDEKVVGMISDRDICLALANENAKFSQVKVEKLMMTKIINCSADDKIEDALRKMRKNQLKRLAVIGKEGKLVGILSVTDVLISVRKNKKLKKKIYKTLEKIFQPRPIVLQEVSD